MCSYLFTCGVCMLDCKCHLLYVLISIYLWCVYVRLQVPPLVCAHIYLLVVCVCLTASVISCMCSYLFTCGVCMLDCKCHLLYVLISIYLWCVYVRLQVSALSSVALSSTVLSTAHGFLRHTLSTSFIARHWAHLHHEGSSFSGMLGKSGGVMFNSMMP